MKSGRKTNETHLSKDDLKCSHVTAVRKRKMSYLNTPFPGSVQARKYRMQQLQQQQDELNGVGGGNGRGGNGGYDDIDSFEPMQPSRPQGRAAVAANGRQRQQQNLQQWMDNKPRQQMQQQMQPNRRMLSSGASNAQDNRRSFQQMQAPPQQQMQPSRPPPPNRQQRQQVQASRAAAPRRAAEPVAGRRVILQLPGADLDMGIDASIAALYRKTCIADSCKKHQEAPLHFASLDLGVPESQSAWQWAAVADALVVYQDLGVTPQMQDAAEAATQAGTVVEYRIVGREWHKARSQARTPTVAPRAARAPRAVAVVPPVKAPAVRAPVRARRAVTAVAPLPVPRITAPRKEEPVYEESVSGSSEYSDESEEEQPVFWDEQNRGQGIDDDEEEDDEDDEDDDDELIMDIQ